MIWKGLSVVFLLVSFSLFGHGSDPDSTSIKTKWDITDSLNIIPAYDEYCGWNQKSIWSHKHDLTKKSDTTSLKLTYDSCDFHAPITGRVTSGYGLRKSRPHYGVDIKLQTGDSVYCVFDGMVRISRYSRTYGHVIVVRHENGLETLYAHLSKRIAEEGDKVETNTLLGLGGNTGRSFGSHLHFEVRYLGEPINPEDVFEINDSTFALNIDTLSLTKDHFAFLKEMRRIKYHRVRSGDSLWRISKRYGISINKLCRLNGISRRKTLKIGQRIRYQ